MAISLQKGQKVDLTKGNSGLSKLVVGLGWDELPRRKKEFFSRDMAIDCDASAALLQNGKLQEASDIVCFRNLTHRSGSVLHLGDNLTGEGDGDDEQIIVDLNRVPSQYSSVIVFVNIYQAYIRKQHFGMIENAFVRVVDARSDTELCRYNLTDDYSNMTAIIFGEIYRNNNEWKFNAIGNGTEDGTIEQVIHRYS
ncbi:MAG: stress protein [Epulopiscium sp. Nuni2H_MBin001]|nr:MAG: stress protein [Epulopiscium sp. Nuni2H_MBin001]